MQNSESTVKAIYGEPVATHGKTSGVVGIRTLSHGANRNAEWCEQTRGDVQTMRPITQKVFGALPFFQNEILCADSLRLLLSNLRLCLQPII
jgi:hypothetical protein